LDIIEKNIDLPWDWSRISDHELISWEFISKHIDKDWNWRRLSTNISIHWQDILDNPKLPWDWSQIGCNHFNNSKEYKYVTKLNYKLMVLANMPKYIKMELIEDKTFFTFYQLYHL
jgi:hypothetical protein